jgi:hypothetical protein
MRVNEIMGSGFSFGPRLCLEQRPHFGVGGLREIAIPLSHRRERLWCTRAHQFVGDRLHLNARCRRAHRNRDHDARGSMRTDRLDGGSHRRSGRKTIVDEDDDASGQGDERPAHSVLVFATFEFGLLDPGHRVDRICWNTRPAHDVVVHHADAARRDRTHRQFRVAWQSQFPDQEDIEWCAERRRHLVGDGHAAAWQRQHHDVVPPGVLIEERREKRTGLTTILKRFSHALSS